MSSDRRRLSLKYSGIVSCLWDLYSICKLTTILRSLPRTESQGARHRRPQRCYCTLSSSSFSSLDLFLQIIPLLSQSTVPLPANFSSESLQALTTRIQFGGDEVVKAKDGAGSATLSMAYAGAEFAEAVIKALKGEKGIVVPSYVNLEAAAGGKDVKGEIGADLEYFSVPVELGVRSTADWVILRTLMQLSM
jgi:hypothetical protein